MQGEPERYLRVQESTTLNFSPTQTHHFVQLEHVERSQISLGRMGSAPQLPIGQLSGARGCLLHGPKSFMQLSPPHLREVKDNFEKAHS